VRNRHHPAEQPLRLAVEVLVAGSGRISERLQAAERQFRCIARDQLSGSAERGLYLRIGAGLVEGGDDDSDVTAAIGMLQEQRAAEIALDIFRLYQVVAGIASGDEHAVGDVLNLGEPGRSYVHTATRDVESLAREAEEAIHREGVDKLPTFLMRAWAAGALAASRDDEIAQAAGLGQRVERAILRGD
jgi:hypothetical protein